MKSLFELDLSKAGPGSREVASTLYRQLRAAILDGRLPRSSRLPSTRSAKTVYGVSRNTAHDVYERLAQDGLAVGRRGSGTYVTSSLPKSTGPIERTERDGWECRLVAFWRSGEVRDWGGYWSDGDGKADAVASVAELRPALVDSDLFPHAVFRQVMARELRRLETRPAAFRGPFGSQGARVLRDAIADHIGSTRAVACDPDDVLVTCGAQQAFDLIARVLVEPGETIVAIEEPGYPPMRVPFAAAGARLVPVRVDDEGIVVDEIPPEAAIVCVCPSHQFPLGMAMSSARRAALLRFARRNRAVIVEDDYDGEFRFDGSPLRALRGSEGYDEVFYVGSFSKSMFPSLRLGFVITPAWARQAMTAAKNAMDWHASVPIQLATAGFIRDGHLARHIRRSRRLYGARRAHLLQSLDQRFGSALHAVPSFYGMHVAALAGEGIDCDRIAPLLNARGVRIHSLSRYFHGTPSLSGFVLSYAVADEQKLDAALDALMTLVGHQPCASPSDQARRDVSPLIIE